MNKNKKAIMVKFLVTILLAIIIFAPACIISSKIFRLSSQAKENFGDFVKEIKEVSAAGEGEKRSFMLIMDKGSFAALFPHDEQTHPADSKPAINLGSKYLGLPPRVVCISFIYPTNECKGKPCLCLCREYRIEEIEKQYCSRGAVCESLFCEVLEGEFEGHWKTVRDDEHPRRTVISLGKEKGKVSLSGGHFFEVEYEEPEYYEEEAID